MSDELPLSGIRVLDFSALGPGPFGTKLLADYGADVIAVESPQEDPQEAGRMFGRGKRSMVINLKADGAEKLVHKLVQECDVVVESMRPGKMQSLGLGPDTLTTKFPSLIYVQLTAFGQEGPLASQAGHDINATSVSGPLAMTGTGQPMASSGLIGDFAGGSLMLVIGVLLALQARQKTGRGQVVDAAMSDGCALLAGGVLPMLNKNQLGPRGSNMIDGSRPFYTTYRCRDGKWLALGAIEPKFFKAFLQGCGLDSRISAADQYDASKAEVIRELIAETLASKDRDEWMETFQHIDACLSPVVEPEELLTYHHNAERGVFYRDGQGVQADVFPRLSKVKWRQNHEAPLKGADTEAILRDLGLSASAIEQAVQSGVVSAR